MPVAAVSIRLWRTTRPPRLPCKLADLQGIVNIQVTNYQPNHLKRNATDERVGYDAIALD